jgi:hypothetical protein
LGSERKAATLAKRSPEAKASSLVTPPLGARSASAKRSGPSWLAYSARPEKPGYLRLQSTVGRWSGQAVVGGWQIPEQARVGIAHALASWRSGAEERIHGRLIRLLVKVSDQFGGRPIRIVSGYRPHAEARFTPHSKHTLGRAVDFSIPGVPNDVLRDYLRASFKEVGIGYYPNSTHVHLDIREEDAYWVDHSGPGQAPAYGGPRRSKALAVGVHPVLRSAQASPNAVVATLAAPPAAAPSAAGTPAVPAASPESAATPAAAAVSTPTPTAPVPSPASPDGASPSETPRSPAQDVSAPPPHDTHTPEDP